jgi:tRNA dimethylallyltransferase
MVVRFQLKKLFQNWKNILVELTKSLNQSQKIIFVVGPTASGKSAWAVQQAKRRNGSIVNIDSVQFYEKLLIGSAAPTESEKAEVPHYLYSYVAAPTEMTAGRYIDDFYKLLENPDLQYPLFVVGGTGFYIQALEKGMFDVNPIPDAFRAKIETELESRGAKSLHQELLTKDPGSKIHLNDHYRLVRAIEIIRFTGKIPSLMQTKPAENKNGLKLPYLKVGFSHEKNIFTEIVRERTNAMLKDGIIDETKYFLERGFDAWAPLASVGYKETVQFIKENLSEKWLKAAIEQSTMKLIKKQKTWFKRDNTILWSNHSGETQQAMGLKLDQFLLAD